MPRGDRTGPAGQGPMTGRRAGRCAGNDVPQYGNGLFGMGFGRGFGFGSDNREVSEKNRLETAISILKNQLQNLEKRHNDLSK